MSDKKDKIYEVYVATSKARSKYDFAAGQLAAAEMFQGQVDHGVEGTTQEDVDAYVERANGAIREAQKINIPLV